MKYAQPTRLLQRHSFTTRNALIIICCVAIFVEISGLVWPGKSARPSETFLKLLEPPARQIQNPYQNGYFLLLGFASAPNANPVQNGYEIWLEADAGRGTKYFDFRKDGRYEQRLLTPAEDLLPAWDAPLPLTEFRKQDFQFRTAVSQHRILLDRYDQWLNLPFEDWGYGLLGSPRFEEIFAAHRLYVAEGFAGQTRTGLDRLQREMQAWRVVLADAKTPSLKIMATTLMDDDLVLLSKILADPAADTMTLTTAQSLAHPLTAEEYSLRWPIRHEFRLGRLAAEHSPDVRHSVGARDADQELIWLAKTSKLHPEAFRRITHPVAQTLLGIPLHSQRLWDTYAVYYEATIKAADSLHRPLPRFQDVARTTGRTLLESATDPLEIEPEWESLSQRLVVTDARLRLASLQIALRHPSAISAVPTRLASMGSNFFDPFTGLPMLWCESQGTVYSVGKDGLDDGGDPVFDISVPAVLPKSPS
jgi:hypothetical protein